MNLKKEIRKGIDFIKDPYYRLWVLAGHGIYDAMPDEKYLRKQFKAYFSRELNLENPQTICEKIQWLKLYNRRPEYTNMVDKYEVKKYVASIIGNQYIIPTYGIWNHFDDIDFNNLPDQFVLKATHDSGSYVVVSDKKKMDKKTAKRILEKSLKRNYFFGGREWPYKNVKPRIIAEKYIDTLGKPDSIEYKTTCFNGKVGFVTICTGIPHKEYSLRTNDFFDTDFNHLPFYTTYYLNAKKELKKPAEWDELLDICEKLSAGIPYVRIDTYIVNGHIYFGEMTFFTWSGYMKFEPEEYDKKLGDMIKLPPKYIEQ